MLSGLTVRRLFLIDAVGAAATALMLGFVLPALERYIGMPRAVLSPLAIVAALFAIYSFACHGLIKSAGPTFLKAIAIANGLYCLVTLGLLVRFRDVVTTLGFAYFLGEIVIILALVTMEWRVAGRAPGDSRQD